MKKENKSNKPVKSSISHYYLLDFDKGKWIVFGYKFENVAKKTLDNIYFAKEIKICTTNTGFANDKDFVVTDTDFKVKPMEIFLLVGDDFKVEDGDSAYVEYSNSVDIKKIEDKFKDFKEVKWKEVADTPVNHFFLSFRRYIEKDTVVDLKFGSWNQVFDPIYSKLLGSEVILENNEESVPFYTSYYFVKKEKKIQLGQKSGDTSLMLYLDIESNMHPFLDDLNSFIIFNIENYYIGHMLPSRYFKGSIEFLAYHAFGKKVFSYDNVNHTVVIKGSDKYKDMCLTVFTIFKNQGLSKTLLENIKSLNDTTGYKEYDISQYIFNKNKLKITSREKKVEVKVDGYKIGLVIGRDLPHYSVITYFFKDENKSKEKKIELLIRSEGSEFKSMKTRIRCGENILYTSSPLYIRAF